MSFTLSPGVAIQEIDTTTIVPQVATTTAAFAGLFRWGPINYPVLIDKETTLRENFQPPSRDTAIFYYSAANFLDYGNALYVSRANTGGVKTATANSLASVMVANPDKYFMNYYNGNSGLYGPWFARYAGALGNNLIVSICPSAEAFSSNLTTQHSLTASANIGNTTVVCSGPVGAYVTPGDTVSVGVGTGVSNGYISVVSVTGNNVVLSASPVSANGTGLTIARRWQYYSQFPGAPGTSQYASTVNGANDEMHIIVLDANAAFYDSATPNYILEKWSYVSKAVDAINNDSTTNYYKDVLYHKSKYILSADHLSIWDTTSGLNSLVNGNVSLSNTGNWGNTALGTTFTNIAQPSTITLVGGSDETTHYNPAGFSGGISDTNDAGLIAAYNVFQDADQYDISLVFAGPGSPTVQQNIIDNISGSRLDCMTFVSPRYNDVINNQGLEATTIVNSYLPDLGRSSSYVVVDSGWKYQFDKYNNRYFYVPLNADIAGLCAYTDKVRDAWWSPAGLNRGNIKNVVKLAWNPGNSTTNPYRDLLYQNGVNPVITMKGQGTVLFGDKTLQSKPSAFDRINVRRLFIVLEKAIAIAAKYSLFEFNDEFTRTAFVNMVTPYLTQIQGGRGITAFRVVCDTTNNTPAVIDANQFVGDIYIKPARSINFIQLRFVAVGTGVDFQEIVGQF